MFFATLNKEKSHLFMTSVLETNMEIINDKINLVRYESKLVKSSGN